MENFAVLRQIEKNINGIKMKKMIFAIFIVFICSSCSASSSEMSGTVIDAETGKPIEGAVVLVEWTKTKGFGFTRTESYKVIEVLTDKDGKFKVSGVINPFVNAPDVTIYKKGYVCWNSSIIFPDYRNRTDFKWDKTYTFKLEHFKPEYSYDKHTSFISSATRSWTGNKQLIKESYRWEELEASKERNRKSN